MVTDFKFTLTFFGALILGLLTCSTVTVAANSLLAFLPGMIAVTVLTVTMFCVFFYLPAWRQGFKDRNYIAFGHMEARPLRALLCASVAHLPHFLLACVYFYFVQIVGNLPNGLNVAARLSFMPYLCLVDALVVKMPYLFFLLLLPSIGAAVYGYYNGLRDFSLREHLVYQKADNKK